MQETVLVFDLEEEYMSTRAHDPENVVSGFSAEDLSCDV
jgi:hypothetical protein